MSQKIGVLLRRLAPPPPAPSPPPSPSPAPNAGGQARFSLANLNPLAQGTITISFEGTSARVLLVRGEVKQWQNIALSPRSFRNGVIVDAANVGQALTTALRQAGLGRGRVVAALPEAQAASRIISIPSGAQGSINTVVPREMRRQMPLDEESNYRFWQMLPPRAGQQRAYTLTIPKAPLVALVESLRIAGLKPKALDLKPLALARALGRPEAIIANGESSSLEVVIVAEGVPTLRSVFLGDTPPPSDEAQARLLEELTRAISLYNDTNHERPLNPDLPVFLCGELALNPDLRQEVIKATGRPVPPLDCPIPYPPDFPLALFMVNIGLTLKKT